MSTRTPAVFIFCAALLFGGCNQSRKKQIAVIPKSTSSLFYQPVHAGANAAGEQFGVDILWSGPPVETDYSRQIEIVDSMITRHVDGLAIAASERNALNHSLDRAAAAGIPVTIFDSGVDSTNYMTFVATDNVEAGRMAGRKMGELLGGKGKVALILHAPGSYSTMDREKGFKEVIAKNFPGIHVVAEQYSGGDRAKAMGVAEDILTANSDLAGMFGSSEPCAVGGAQALKSRGLAGKVKLIGFDASEGLIQDLKEGVFEALVVQDPFKMGFEAVRTISDKLAGKAPEKRLDLNAVVVTKADLEKPDIHTLLYPDLKRYLK
ncbi:MAG TPA: substrate-binding domain-containing protein [Bryobacteraceae bacterium]